jgi:hypothetical protein
MVKNVSIDSCCLKLNAIRKEPRADYNWYLKGSGNKFNKIGSGFSIDSIKASKNSQIYLKVRNACGTDSSMQKFVFVSVQSIKNTAKLKCIETSIGKEISIPNKSKTGTIELIDLQGRIVDTKSSENTNLYTIPKVKSGMYYLFLNHTMVFKLILD